MKQISTVLFIVFSFFWMSGCRDNNRDQLRLENQKLQKSLNKAKEKKGQLQEELRKKSDDMALLGRFISDFLCDPSGSAAMQAYLRNNRDYIIDFGRMLGMTSCAPGSEEIPLLRFDKGDRRPEIINKVAPSADWLRFARAEGIVILEVRIDTRGRVRCPCIIYGNPLFNGYAWEAVVQWKYKPYLINGKPSPVRFAVTVQFKMGAE